MTTIEWRYRGGEELQGSETEPRHPGWLPLVSVLETDEAIFRDCLFMPGFDISSNIYLLAGEDLVIVDPGNDYTAYMELFDTRYSPEAVKKVVLTHGHRDHSMGVFELLRAYPGIQKRGGFELVMHEAGPPELKEVPRQFGCLVTEVRGGETLRLGQAEWEVVYTPGHTIDGICLVHAPSKTAFTGDMVQPHLMAEPDKNAGGDLRHYLYGIKKLLKKDIENILPGHGSPVAAIGRRIVEETYIGLLLRIIGTESPIPWMDGALALLKRGLPEETVFCLDKELARRPANSKALHVKALCLNELGRFEEAIEALDELEKLESREEEVFSILARGYALMGLGSYEASVGVFDRVLREDPKMHDALVYKGMALYLSGRREEAMEITPFRNEFVVRFKEEMARSRRAPGSGGG
ncbi:MAG: MBL fold metallo-hydrolase [Syntrophobacteraceae bacterium]|nr:MBL fold metallo-hydrolase [Syntrophobacteraceae bacterium]